MARGPGEADAEQFMTAARAGDQIESAELFRTTFANAPIGMVLFRLDRSTLQVNRALCDVLGYSEEELLAVRFRDMIHPDDLDILVTRVENALSGETESYEEEIRFIRRDGRVIWMLVHASLVRDREDSPFYLASQCLDITSRKEAEAERAAIHQRTRQVLERITDGFFALDREWRITYFNEAAERLVNRSRDELLGTNVWESFSPAIDTPLYETAQRAMAHGATESLEVYYAPLEAWFDVRAYPSPDGLSVFFRDVTASRQLRRDLEASEERYRSLMQQLPAVVYVLDAGDAHKLLYISPFIEELTGYTADEVISREQHWLERVHPADRDRVAAADARATAHREPLRIEYRYCRKDGRFVWVLDDSVPILDETGGVVAIQGVLLDISDRVAAEEGQARLAAIVASAEDGILSCTLDGIITSWNRGAEKLYGYTTAEAIGEDVAMLRPPELADDIAELVEGVRQGRSVEGHETVRMAKDGRRIDISMALSPIRDAGGRVVAIASISRDISALREAERALRLRDRALAAAPNGVVITDATRPGNPIVDANPAFETLTGYTRAEMIGRDIRVLRGPGTDPVAVRRIEDAIRAGRDTTETLLNYRKDGTPYWVELHLAAVRDETGALTHFVEILIDVTGRVRVEETLRDALADAQAATRTKSLFLAMMSHELRTPLQAVLGYADLLQLGPPGSLTAEQAEDVGRIQQGAHRMIALIDQMLDLSRMEAGRLELAARPVDLAGIIEQARQDVAPQAVAKGLSLQVEISPALPPVLGDPDRLRQIVLNLAGNAVKFTDHGSVRIEASANDGGVRVAVSDTGIGISGEALPYIFEEFRQADDNLTRRFGGAGLGLAIARRLAEQMGGTITVASTPRAGSTFTLHLPAATRRPDPTTG